MGRFVALEQREHLGNERHELGFILEPASPTGHHVLDAARARAVSSMRAHKLNDEGAVGRETGRGFFSHAPLSTEAGHFESPRSLHVSYTFGPRPGRLPNVNECQPLWAQFRARRVVRSGLRHRVPRSRNATGSSLWTLACSGCYVEAVCARDPGDAPAFAIASAYPITLARTLPPPPMLRRTCRRS